MLDIKFIRENPDLVKEAISRRGLSADVDALLKLDEERREALQSFEEAKAIQNKVSDEIAQISDPEEKQKKISEMKATKDSLKEKEDVLKDLISEWQKLMLKIPNMPTADTPTGKDDSENKVIKQWGEKRDFSFTPKDHEEIGILLGLIDTKTASEVSGARFSYLKGDLVRLQFALIQFCLDIFSDKEILDSIAKEANLKIEVKPFIPVIPPVFVKPIVQVKMARFMTPEEHYMFPNDDLMLIGSAEHTLGSMHIDHVFKEEELPIRYVGYSTAFRREAGSYGKDTKGILRQHQFDKLEMEVFSLPENSLEEQNFLVGIQEYILQQLNLPYQVVSVCTGDMGFPDNRQMDIETWMPGQNNFRETHSADSTGGFQARRLNTRVRRADGNIEPVHMNDATAIALGRTLIAIIENYQNEDGSIKIPEVLQKYLGGKDKITK